jgi:hypothetical protein
MGFFGSDKSGVIKGLLIGAACIATIAYLMPSGSLTNAESENKSAPAFTPISSVSQQTEAIKPTVDAPVTHENKGGTWYVIENSTGKCKADEGPVEMMKSLKALGQPYEVKEDVVEGNRPMQVSLLLNDGNESGQIVYYRGKTRCRAQADKKKRSTDAEFNRYK